MLWLFIRELRELIQALYPARCAEIRFFVAVRFQTTLPYAALRFETKGSSVFSAGFRPFGAWFCLSSGFAGRGRTAALSTTRPPVCSSVLSSRFETRGGTARLFQFTCSRNFIDRATNIVSLISLMAQITNSERARIIILPSLQSLELFGESHRY